MDLKDKVVVITGASRGFGKELAKIFAARGARVVVSARNGEDLQKVAAEIGVAAILADVTDEQALRDLCDTTVAQFGRVDIWINNAGIWVPHVPAEKLDMAQVHAMFEVNVFGVMYGCRAALVQMKKQREGTIVNIVSSSALNARPMASAYAASKWAERGFTDALREEARGLGIKVIGVYPGGMKTLLFDEEKPAEYSTYMDPAEVAEKVVANLEQNIPEEEQKILRQR